MTDLKKYEHRIIDSNIGYFRFFEDACEEVYREAFDDYTKMVTDERITKLIVVNDRKGKWDQVIENTWVQTAKMAEQYGIKKWGIVTPDSAIREMTLKRVVKKGNYNNNPNYDFFLSRNESEVLDWIRQN